MATLDIEFKTKGFSAGERQIRAFSQSLDRLERTSNNLKFDSLVNNVGKVEQKFQALGTTTRDIANSIKTAFGGISFNKFVQDITANKSHLVEVRREAVAFATELSKIDRQAFSGMNAGVKDLAKSFRTLNLLASQFRSNSTAANGGASSLQQARLDAANYRTEIARLNRDLAALRLAQAQNRQGGQAASGSYREAQQRLTALGQAIRNAAGGFNSADPAVQRQIKAYRDLNDQLKKFDAQMGNHQRNVGNYGAAFANAIPYLNEFTSAAGVMGVAVSGVKKAFDTNLKFEAVNQALRYTSGSSYEFSKNLQFLANVSDRLGLDLISTSQSFKMWQGAAKFSNLTADETRRIFESVANAGAKMKLSNDQVQGTFLALSQMMSKGKVQAEELRGQLGERLPGAFALAAKAMGVTEAELNKMLETGQVVAGDFLPKFANQLDIAFSNDKTQRITSMQGSVNRLSTEFDNLFKSENASSFFTVVIDGLTKTTKAFGNMVSSSGWKGFFDKIALFNPMAGSSIGPMIGSGVGDWFAGGLGLDAYKDYRPNLNRVRGTGALESNPLAGFVDRGAFKGLDNKFGFGGSTFNILPAKDIEKQTEALIRNKKYWDDQVKSITASRDALDANQIGSKQWIQLTEQLKNAQSNLDKFSNSKSNKQSLKESKEQSDYIKRINEIRNQGLNYYDKSIVEITQRYDELTKGIKGADLAQAQLNEQAEKYKVWSELFGDVFKDMRKQSIEPAFGEAKVPANIGDKMAQSAKDYYARFFLNPKIKFSKDQEDKDAERLQNRLSKVVESGMRQGIGGILGDISQLGSNFQQVFTNVFSNLAGSLNKTLQDVIATELGSKLSKLFDSDNFQIGKLSKDISKGIVAGAGIAGGLISSMTSPTSKLGQGLGGALTGAAAGTAIAPGIGTLIGGAIGAISGIFGASQAEKARKLQEQQVLEQKRTNMLLERQQALTFTSQITGQSTNQGIVTGVERNEFGDITFEIEGRKLKAVVDKENEAQLKGVY